jgi:hypothetical protein
VYAATLDVRPLTFEVAGFWRRNMLMRDRQTGSIWQQATGEAVAGPLRGRQLEVLGGAHSTWAAWRREHPLTVVAVEPAHAPRGLAGLLPFTWIWNWSGRIPWTPPGLAATDTRLPPHEEVAGLSIAGEARAYPLSVLRRRRVVNDELGGVPLAIVYEPHGDRMRAFDGRIGGVAVTLASGDDVLTDLSRTMRWSRRGEPIGSAAGEPLRALPVARQFWLAWSEFHPGTTVYADPIGHGS